MFSPEGDYFATLGSHCHQTCTTLISPTKGRSARLMMSLLWLGEILKVLVWGSFRRLTCNKGYLPRTHSLYSWCWHKDFLRGAQLHESNWWMGIMVTKDNKPQVWRNKVFFKIGGFHSKQGHFFFPPLRIRPLYHPKPQSNYFRTRHVTVQRGNERALWSKVCINSVFLFDRLSFIWTSHTSWLAQSETSWQRFADALVNHMKLHAINYKFQRNIGIEMSKCLR